MPFREAADAAFHEEVAREHLEQGMPVVELHRNHGVPLASVENWIALYRRGGRAALEAAASEIARKDARPLTRKQLETLTEKLGSSDPDLRRVALIVVGRRRVGALTAAVFSIVEQGQSCVIDALLTLGDLGARSHLDRAEKLLGADYRGWIAGARKRMPR